MSSIRPMTWWANSGARRSGPTHPYGYSILGTAETVRSLGHDDLRRLHDAGYYPGNIVIALAGRIEHQQVLDALAGLGWLAGDARPPRAPAGPPETNRGALRHEARDLQQVHAIVGTDSVNATDPRRWGLALLATALGGGMSSRLFQRVREELGLCYAVNAWQTTYRAAGSFGIYVGTQPATATQALEAIGSELAGLAAEGLPAAGIVRRQRAGPRPGAAGAGKHREPDEPGGEPCAALDEPYRSVDEVLARIDGVTATDNGRHWRRRFSRLNA